MNENFFLVLKANCLRTKSVREMKAGMTAIIFKRVSKSHLLHVITCVSWNLLIT